MSFTEALAGIAARSRDLRPALQRSAERVTHAIDERWDAQPWRARADGSPATLERTGAARRSLRIRTNPRSLLVYSVSPYLKYHVAGAGRLPVRDPLSVITPALLQEIEGDILDYLVGGP